VLLQVIGAKRLFQTSLAVKKYVMKLLDKCYFIDTCTVIIALGNV